MKRLFTVVLLLVGTTLIALAQTPREQIAADPNRAGNNYYSYPCPDQRLTPPPAGYDPFYISHYGRHGSRWCTGVSSYTQPLAILRAADSMSQLTAAGREVLAKVEWLNKAANRRYGELTPLGARQHRAIAERMYANFPAVFADSAFVDARSTVVIRCILSMESACQKLKECNPALKISNDASQADMYYMNYEGSDDKLTDTVDYTTATAAIEAFSATRTNSARLLGRLLIDPSVLRSLQLGSDNKPKDYSDRLYRRLFDLAVANQCLDSDCDLMSLFTPDELYDQWTLRTVEWYCYYANSPLTGGAMPLSQLNLLANILDSADRVIASGLHGATLRFGHDTNVMPLVCLLEIDDCAYSTDNFDELIERWAPYRIVPMAANVQFVFYRNGADDVIVKVLLNEHEARLPVATDMAPYYRWSDVESYYRNKLSR